MSKFEVFILCLCLSLTVCELVGPDSRKGTEKKEENDDASELDGKQKEDTEYWKEVEEVVKKEMGKTTNEKLASVKEFAEAIKASKNLLKSDDKDSKNIKEFTIKLLNPSIFRQSWQDLKNDIDEDMKGENAQDILDTLPYIEDEEEELSPELQEAKQLYDEAVRKLNRRTPDIEATIQQVKQAADAGYVPAMVRMGWAHVFAEGVELDVDKAKEIFQTLADEGNAEAHAGMGFLYASGVSVPVSQAKALVHYTLGALGESSFAQMALAYRYWAGISVPSSCNKALDLYMKVAAKVASEVTFSGGPAVVRTRLVDEAEGGGALDTDLIEYYQLLAEKGDVQAQVVLGQLHFQGGRGVTLDLNKALHYFSQAAKTGNAAANAFLGKIYLEGGDGIKSDNETALKYFRKAAELNNAVGQSGLGLMYLQGRGVPKDTNAAFKYFTMAANQGWVDGQLYLGFMYFGGIGVRHDFKQANKYFSLASQTGHVLALYHLALMHAHGLGVGRSCTTAVELFKNVCERGWWSARLMAAAAAWRAGGAGSAGAAAAWLQYRALGERGLEVAQSNAAFVGEEGGAPALGAPHARALQMWRRAAAQGSGAARLKLGDYHYYGLGTPRDAEAAAQHYRVAGEQLHVAQATFNLGLMHLRGEGLARDPHLAKRCFDLAADTSPDARLPAALARAHLAALAALERLAGSPLALVFLAGESRLAANWDVYVITSLLAALGLLVFLRRPPQAA